MSVAKIDKPINVNIPIVPAIVKDICTSKQIEVNVEINKEAPKKIDELSCEGELLKIEKTNEDEFVDIESIDSDVIVEESSAEIVLADIERVATPVEQITIANENTEPISLPIELEATKLPIADEETISSLNETKIVLRNQMFKLEEHLSTSVPIQRSRWPIENNTPPMLNRGSLNFSEMFSNNIRREHDFNVRHSMSTTMAMRQENDTIAMIRGASSCSKDTVLFIDQPGHGYMDDDNSYMGSRSLWVILN